MVFTLLGARLGMGIVGIPYVAIQVGFVFAVIFQVLFIAFGILSIWLLLQARALTGKSSFSELGIY
jgi:amino acid permease